MNTKDKLQAIRDKAIADMDAVLEQAGEWKPKKGEWVHYCDNQNSFMEAHLGVYGPDEGEIAGTNWGQFAPIDPLKDNLLPLIEWDGGECPVEGRVLVLLRSESWTIDRAEYFEWGNNESAGDIIRYTVLPEKQDD